MTRPSKPDRKALIKAWKEGERSIARMLFPLADAQLEQFFALLESRHAKSGCFHDIRHSLAVIEVIGLSATETDALLDWCNDHGGYCDCEIVANTYLHWRDSRTQLFAAHESL